MSEPNENMKMFEQPKYQIQGPEMEYPASTLHRLFEERALLLLESNAIKHDGKQISYGILRIRVNQMAHYLWSKGIRPGVIVAISLDRSPDLITTLFAILQCGATYLPLDPKFPQSRLEFMLKDSDAKFLVSTKKISESLPIWNNTLLIEDALSNITKEPETPLDIIVDEEQVAYLLYTSGSTGKPKGVSISHKNLINFLYSMMAQPGITENDRLLSITTISFDIAGLELYLPLLKGAMLVFADDTTIKDGSLLLELLQNEKISILQATPTTWQTLLDAGWELPLSLKALCGGEPMPLNLAHKLLERCDELWNMYGPTETTIWSTIKQIQKNDELITIGKPIANTQIYLLDENNKPVEFGAIGEIVIGGDGVAQGYWKRLELTSEKFIPNPFSNKPNSTLYRTGDLGKLLLNGDLQCFGRIDEQVKIRGHRIELGEIEAVLNSISSIKQSAVIVRNDLGSESKIVAYLKSDNELPKDTKTIRNELSKILPDILIPSYYMWLNEFPITPNGKIDKKNLPLPEYVRPDSAPLLKHPRTKFEKEAVNIWSEQLQIPHIGIDDNFFDLGGTSILAQKVVSLMKERLKIDISVSKIYTHPTISELSSLSVDNITNQASFVLKTPINPNTSKDIAIIGMAGRYPGAKSIDELWKILKNGEETITFFTKEELDISIPDEVRNDPFYVTARGILPSAKTFDAAFFGLNPLIAKAMDPQHRLFLEICWEALEQSGYLPKHYKGTVGVYAGCENNSYFKHNIFPNEELQEQVGKIQIESINEKDFIAPRVAYHLNLKGPAVSVHSACSTSLLAVAEAVNAIRSGQCDVALAGGSSVTSPIYSGHPYDEGFIKNPDGRTRPFDAAGKGTVFSDGAGVVLLKNLEAAKKDGDTIYGIIKGVGVNNDGGDKGSFMAPSSIGQSGAIIKALNDAQVLPSSISYVEAHGTATLVGDPIEIEGLKIAYGKQDKNGYCAIGSVKGNFGHTTAAAGVAGLLKVILSMQHKQIPPLVGFSKPNPHIDFENSPFYINAKLSDWNTDGPRLAGVSSFGVGSTNVHVIVEDYEMKPISSTNGRPTQLLTWSAKTQNSLLGYNAELGNFINKSTSTSLADVAYSLNVTRDDFNHRSFLVTDSNKHATKNLISSDKNIVKSSILKIVPTEIGFLFPGQGSQYLQMGKTLYDNEKVFRDAIDECAELLKDSLKLDIRKIIYPENNSEEAQKLLKNTLFTQPALFITEYALSQLWISWGIKPTLLCGHSVGEFVAAHLAGILNLKDALFVIATRSRLVSELPGGSMLSVRLSEDRLKEMLPKSLSIAAVNSKQLCVVAGTDKDIEDFSKALQPQDIPHKVLFTSHAFHSPMMEPMLESFEDALKKVTLNVPRLPIVSTVTGKWLTDTEATSVSYWVNHVKNTVRFANAMDTILEEDNFILLEVGPGKSLTSLAQQQAAGKKIISAFSSLNLPKEDEENEYTSILNALGEMWLKGINPDWNSFYKEQKRQKINLPSYVFDRKLCWVDPVIFDKSTLVQKQTINVIPKVEEVVVNTSIKIEDTSRVSNILNKILEIMNHASGISYGLDSASNSFLELGLDSLTLSQLSGILKKEFDFPITFRQLNQDLSSPMLLADFLNHNLPKVSEVIETHNAKNEVPNRVPKILSKILEIMTHASGISYDLNSGSYSFLELGLDSLTLSQLSGILKKEFDFPITFRQLNQDLSSPELLADFLNLNLPEEQPEFHGINNNNKTLNSSNQSIKTTTEAQKLSSQHQITLEQIVEQLHLLNNKIEALQNNHTIPVNGASIVKNIKAESLHLIDVNRECKNGFNSFEKTDIFNDVSKKINQKDNKLNISDKYSILADEPPMPGAKLGRDEAGNPAWFIPNPDQTGNYIKIEL
ncbi:polyketide synthase [Confluentibacter sediminis]|uniref:polyketide synthase n=1 Tax=Confluentibacter sediminis TaxID=2219045 RepID=UPI000DACC783|nr:polyketide synthase [Confluentibacter sediminis]